MSVENKVTVIPVHFQDVNGRYHLITEISEMRLSEKLTVIMRYNGKQSDQFIQVSNDVYNALQNYFRIYAIRN